MLNTPANWHQAALWLLAFVSAAAAFYAPASVQSVATVMALPMYLWLIILAAGICNKSAEKPALWNAARVLLLAEHLSITLLGVALMLLPAWFFFAASRPLYATLLAASALLLLQALFIDHRWLSVLAYQPEPSKRIAPLRRALAAIHAQHCQTARFFSVDTLGNALYLLVLALPFALVFMPLQQRTLVMPWLGYALLLAPAAALLLLKPQIANADIAAPSDSELASWLKPRTEPSLFGNENTAAQHQADAQTEAFAQMLAWSQESLASAQRERSRVENLEQTLDENAQPLTELIAKTQQLALFTAILQNDLVQVEALLKSGANPNLALSDQYRERRSPLLLAASLGQSKMARVLLEAGAEVNLPCGGQSALIAATRDSWSGRFDVVMTLLTNGADVHALDADGNSPLHHAARSRDGALIQLLLDAGANTSVANALGCSPLACAAAAGNKIGISALISHRTQDKAAQGWDCATPPLVALGSSPQDDPELVKLLLAHCDANVQDASGRSALHACASHDLLDMGAALINAGANPNLQDQQGCTPLMLAASGSAFRFLQLLASTNASVSLLDSRRQSALHYLSSADAPNLEAARLLIEMLTPAMNFDGIRRNAAELALLRGWWDLARLLNPEHELPGALEAALEPHGTHVPDRIELLKEAASFNRLSVAKVMLKLGPAPQSVLSECIVSLADNLNPDWLQVLRLGGLLLGEKEREPLLTLLARQQPMPKNALQLLLNNGASLAPDSEQDSLLNLVAGAAHDYAGLLAPQTVEIELSLLDAILQRASPALLMHRDASLRHALSWAMEFASTAFIERLLQAFGEQLSPAQSGELLNSFDSEGQSALLYWLRRSGLEPAQQLKITQALIRAGADPNFVGQDGQSPRALALARGGAVVGIVELLTWPTLSHPRRRLLALDVPASAQRGDIVALNRLLICGLSINAFDAQGCTALSHAAGQGNTAMLLFLLAQGADPNAGAQPALHCALRAHAQAKAPAIHDELGAPSAPALFLEIIQTLLRAGADIQLAPHGIDALGTACALLDIDALRCLLAIDPTALRKSLAPICATHALMHAVLAQASEAKTTEQAKQLLSTLEVIFEALLESGADINSPDPEGRSALLIAVGAGELGAPHYPENFERRLILLLIKLGSNTQALDARGRTALHWCCRHRLLTSAEALLNAGADPNTHDYGRKLPIDLANAVDRHDFAALFRGVVLAGSMLNSECADEPFSNF